jgi:GNAT superfamily N-acetyltransferase
MPELPPELRALARRIERANAGQLDRTGPGSSIAVAGGRAVMKGPRSPFSAALGLGLEGPVSAEDLARVEAHLGLAGGPVRVELHPSADASLAEQLAQRGYAVERFLLVWWRPPLPLPEAPPAEVRLIQEGERRAWVEVFAQSYLGGPTQSDTQRLALGAMTRAEGNACFLAFEGGAPAGCAIASALDGVALLSGAGVAPPFRGRGLQRALLRARLAWAAEQGCDIAAGATEPGTASARSLERAGFRCAYPKVVMVRSGGAG